MARVMLFARRPRAGRVKTRLAGEIGAAAALALYRAFLADLLAAMRELGERHDTELWIDGPWEAAIDGPRPLGVTLRRQVAGTLGERLAHGVARAARERALPVVVLGADAPTLPANRIEQALASLAGDGGPDAVVEPAADGGYVLLGLRRHLPALFERIDWGGPEVLRQTLDRARAVGARVEVGAGWFDVDDGRGLERLRRELDEHAAARAPSTARALAALYRDRDDVV